MINLVKFVLLITGLALLVIVLLKQFPEAIGNDNTQISLISTLTILVYFIFQISKSGRNISSIIKQISAWIAIITIAFIGYSYKQELNDAYNRILANLIPGRGQVYQNSTIYYSGNNGHFIINALVNDTAHINFLLDTGASSVTLTFDDAKSLGVDINSLNYTSPANTANGVVWGAPAVINKIQLGSITLNDISATILPENASNTSLLGMTFLNKLSSFQIQGNKLILNK